MGHNYTRRIMVLILTFLLGMGTFLSGLHAATENISLKVAANTDSLNSFVGESDIDSSIDVDLLCSLPSCSGECFVAAFFSAFFVSSAHAKDPVYIETSEAFQRLLQPDPFPPKGPIFT